MAIRSRLTVTLSQETIYTLRCIQKEENVSASRAMDILAHEYKKNTGVERLAELVAEKVVKKMKEKNA